MTWQIAIMLQITAGSLVTLYTRYASLSIRRVFFGVGVISYLAVALVGWLVALLVSDGVRGLPSEAWLPLIVQGVCIPSSWLVQYWLVKNIGASNTVIVTTLNTLLTALMGVVFLGEMIDMVFVLGAGLIVAGILMVLRVKADTAHARQIPMVTTALLALTGALLFSIGLYAEKLTVDMIGAWQYMGFGWTMQALGVIVIFALFGRSELPKINRTIAYKAGTIGLLTSITGGLYIYALSLGALSQTIVATSGKAAIVILLAAIFLHERNDMWVRIAAFALTMTGLALVLS